VASAALAQGVPEPTAAPPPASKATDDAGPGLEEGGGIVYGTNFAFSLQAPKGWLFDNRSGVSQGLHAVAYRTGETYAKSDSLMYARGADPASDGARTLDEFIANDLADFRKNSPGVQTFDIAPVALEDGTPTRIVGYRGDQWGNVEAVAYAEHHGAIYVLVLTARSQARFDADLPAFLAFVRSVMPMDRGTDSGG
jgi:hypothetical protein